MDDHRGEDVFAERAPSAPEPHLGHGADRLTLMPEGAVHLDHQRQGHVVDARVLDPGGTTGLQPDPEAARGLLGVKRLLRAAVVIATRSGDGSGGGGLGRGTGGRARAGRGRGCDRGADRGGGSGSGSGWVVPPPWQEDRLRLIGPVGGCSCSALIAGPSGPGRSWWHSALAPTTCRPPGEPGAPRGRSPRCKWGTGGSAGHRPRSRPVGHARRPARRSSAGWSRSWSTGHGPNEDWSNPAVDRSALPSKL